MPEDIKPNYTRVSNILSLYNDYDDIPKYILDAAATRGTQIHNICQFYAEEGLHLPSQYDSYVEAFVKWYDLEVEKLLSTEERLYCDTYEITGQYDLMVKLKNKQVFLIDIKTCVAEHDTWPLQLAAYAYLKGLKEEKTHMFCERAVLHIKKDGKYKFIHYPKKEKDYDLFLSALKLHRYFKKD